MPPNESKVGEYAHGQERKAILEQLDELLGQARELGLHDDVGLPDSMRTDELQRVANYRSLLLGALEKRKVELETRKSNPPEIKIDPEREKAVIELVKKLAGALAQLHSIIGTK